MPDPRRRKPKKWTVSALVLLAMLVMAAWRASFVDLTQDNLLVWLSQMNDAYNISIARSCLTKTTPNLQLAYPVDAEEHFREIQNAMRPWSQNEKHKMHFHSGYRGPWIENHWISHFEPLIDSKGPDQHISDIYGPFIPLFVPWVDLWVPKRKYPVGLVDALLSVLRPNVPYITVSQNAEGMTSRNKSLAMDKIPNVLVMSAGGYGHVPVPLFKQIEQRRNSVRVQDRPHFLSYVGSLTNAPWSMRKELNKWMRGLLNNNYRYFKGSTWRDVMAKSKFSLAPRGFGRTSFHLLEIMQCGLIPIHVYTDVPWVPYGDMFDKIGYTTKAGLSDLEQLVEKLKGVSDDEIRQREELIVSLRTTHFEPKGVMEQIAKFLLHGEDASDLRCQALPNTVRDCENCDSNGFPVKPKPGQTPKQSPKQTP